MSNSWVVHDENAIFVDEASVEIQEDVCDKHQIHHPVYYLREQAMWKLRFSGKK